ncbi:sigma-70 family RNA polymerase sigma factor [Sphingopyxis sp. KK2]|uniref:sigma-70 family RNA polymerase sigma factor n=1 Tax=Sphingopyxis sp. KK2 TaxID=1855727 RepID=UPI00097E6200|nr:sigma-70 family RNA polymerase sigma factor [Sphingopyxis sp. KK2]
MIAEDDDQDPDDERGCRKYTFEEVVEGLRSLGAPQFAILNGVSRGLAGTAGMEPDELMNEAFVRVIDARTCPVDVDMVGFCIMTMKSIASTAHRKRKKEVAEGTKHVPIAANDGALDPADDAVSPENEALSRIFHGECLARVDAAISDDEELQLLVMGLCDNLIGKKLEELLGTNTKGLAAARKRLAKRLAKAFPAGSPVRSKD